ncbi:uncharacterized protein LOC120276064 [Dioscorea cayenensis subsp. rotundata]|uniref:Uncharacterized protein LOC120276064 n=1 Tax=Dioscorea cayennensis subsp. rotundata TaxID=55577 RepID=A0AB40CFP3_DIOCR|nr:uncharacterized protein LOC120276064 [Dioscorea cayenensis subsp. rotundata]
MEDPINTPAEYGKSHKWMKRSIFWNLPYWKTNLIRHNLDVLHIEKNVFENVFYTVMNVKGKSKDNMKARKDVGILCDRKEIAIPSNSISQTIPKALYTLTKDQRRVICEWLHNLRFPDGYASNLGKCVDMNALKITCMKSHDCHTICSAMLDIDKLMELEKKVAVILCNLEKIFPPSFFDSMEHLIIHLPYEARIGGINDGAFEPFSIFNYIGRSQGRPKIRWLSENKLHVAHTYILRNCPEVQPYYKIFVNYLQGNSLDAINKAIDKHFAKWFENFVANKVNQVIDPLLQSLAWGPSMKVTTWPGYFINGYNFDSVTHGIEKATMNSGICVQGSNVEEICTDFYGLLQDVVQLEYHGNRWNRVVLFECTWFDPINGTKVNPLYKLVDVNRKKMYAKYDPFVLAQQAIQVNYIEYPSMKKDKVDWLAVCKTKAKRMVEASWPGKDSTAYQMEEITSNPVISIIQEIPSLVDP